MNLGNSRPILPGVLNWVKTSFLQGFYSLVKTEYDKGSKYLINKVLWEESKWERRAGERKTNWQEQQARACLEQSLTPWSHLTLPASATRWDSSQPRPRPHTQSDKARLEKPMATGHWCDIQVCGIFLETLFYCILQNNWIGFLKILCWASGCLGSTEWCSTWDRGVGSAELRRHEALKLGPYWWQTTQSGLGISLLRFQLTL